MTEFEKLIEELKSFPTMNSAVVYDGDEPLLRNGKAIEAQTIRIPGRDSLEIETEMVARVRELINGKECWVRVMPYIKPYESDVVKEFCLLGYARIAVV